MTINIAVPREILAGETRVAVVPDLVGKLSEKHGWSFFVQSGAGEASGYSDADYESAGATVLPDAGSVYAKAGVTFHVQIPTAEQIAQLPEGSALVSML